MATPDWLAELGEMDAYTLADGARRAGVGSVICFLRPQTARSVFIGRAVTARLEYSPNRPVSLKEYGGWRLHDNVGPGEVAVLDGGGLPLTVMGALAVANMAGRGAAAAVVNALVRDVEEMEEENIPVFARGTGITTAAGNARVGHVGEPVHIGGAAISSGDLIAGCRGGIVVIAWHERVAALAEARRIRESDSSVLAGIRRGEDVAELWRKHKDL